MTTRHNTTTTTTLPSLDAHMDILQQTSSQLTIMFIVFIAVFTSCIVFLCLSRRRVYANDNESEGYESYDGDEESMHISVISIASVAETKHKASTGVD